MQVHPHEKIKRKDFIHPTIDELNEARNQGWTQDFKLRGPEISEKKIQIYAHIVLINYQPR